MKIEFDWKDIRYEADISQPLDISIPLAPNGENPNCFYAPPPSASPVESGNFVGSTRKGGLVNFMNLTINPHGNGTHTECYGHITTTNDTINSVLKQTIMPCMVLSCFPELKENGDRVIDMQVVQLLDEQSEIQKNSLPKALVIRTLPNEDSKLTRMYSGTNPPYVSPEFLLEIRKRGVQHLLIDLPSVDREEDGGQLAGHKAFWGINNVIQKLNTITELIYVPSLIKDGLYLLQLSISSLEMDVSPSKPVLYRIKKL